MAETELHCTYSNLCSCKLASYKAIDCLNANVCLKHYCLDHNLQHVHVKHQCCKAPMLSNNKRHCKGLDIHVNCTKNEYVCIIILTTLETLSIEKVNTFTRPWPKHSLCFQALSSCHQTYNITFFFLVSTATNAVINCYKCSGCWHGIGS